MKKITNNPDLEFSDLSDERWRIYTFVEDGKEFNIKIVEPTHLNVSKSGGHRVFDSENISHYIPCGWIHLQWKAKEGRLPFAF